MIKKHGGKSLAEENALRLTQQLFRTFFPLYFLLWTGLPVVSHTATMTTTQLSEAKNHINKIKPKFKSK